MHPHRLPALCAAFVLAACGDAATGPFGRVPAGVSGRIAYSTGPDLYVWDVRGGSVNRILLVGQDTVVTTVSWASRDSLIVGLRYLDTLPGTVLERRDEWILKLAANGGGARRLFDESASEMFPAVARDGRVAWCMVRSGSPRLRVGVDTLPFGCWERRLNWSPTGDWLVVSSWGSVDRLPTDGSDAWERLIDWPGVDSVIVIPHDVAVAPDGARLAIGAWEELTGSAWTQMGLWISDSLGQGLTRLTGDRRPSSAWADDSLRFVEPAWSPDGTTIAYIRLDAIWVVPAAGGTPQRLAAVPGIRTFAWTN